MTMTAREAFTKSAQAMCRHCSAGMKYEAGAHYDANHDQWLACPSSPILALRDSLPQEEPTARAVAEKCAELCDKEGERLETINAPHCATGAHLCRDVIRAYASTLPQSAQNNAEAQHEVGNTQPEHGAAVSGPAAASAPFARNDSGKRKNTPIADLMAQYTAENCDFTDMDWVRKAAMLYVDRMEDCQVRCLLHALVSETQRSPDAWRYRYGKDGGWKYTEYKSDINPGKEYESQPLYAPSPSGVEEGVAAPEKRKA